MNVAPRLTAAVFLLGFSLPAAALPLQAVLRLKERVPVERLANEVRDSSSARYRAYYTPEEIRDLSAPAVEDYSALLSQLSSDGFTVVAESPTHLWLTVEAEASTFESVFGARVLQLGEKLRRVDGELRIPGRYLLVESVSGLDNTRRAHPQYQIHSGGPLQALDKCGGVAQATIKSAYGFDPIYQSGWSGKGQHIAIATYDGFYVDDVKQFYKDSALKPGPSVDQVQYNGTPTYDENSAMETQLDAEFSGMIAPGASIHVFASAHNDDAGELQMFTAILDDNRAKVVNYSWGSCEKQLTADHQAEMDKVFARAVAQGVNIMVASGDSGSDGCQDGSVAADWPAAHNDVVAVGGTTFGGDASSPNETAWNGSGGGISATWALPSWQGSLGGAYVKRSYPDVSFNADPNSGQGIWAHSNGTAQCVVIGGTSMAAPQWSGFLALVGEARATKGEAALGFLDPIIYGMSASDRASCFNDVTSGSNGAYNAGAGWDAVTGWGSPKGSALLSYLVGAN
jgi:kumamolisin